MNPPPALSRRDFVQQAAALGGLLVAFRLSPRSRGATPDSAGAAAFAPNAFLRLAPDGAITIIAKHCEMGQGICSSIAMCVAEELDADWSRLAIEFAPIDPAYNRSDLGTQITGGSTSTRLSFLQLRQAGATARWLLLQAAAQQWQVDPDTLRTSDGVVLAPDGRRAAYGSLAAAAAKLTPPAEVKLKDPSQFKFIGKSLPRLDARDKVTGKTRFGFDVRVPGMLTALIARPPTFGGTLKSFNPARAQAIPGVKHVVAVPAGVAVVADNFWAAQAGRDALSVDWHGGPLVDLDSVRQGADYARLARQSGAVARHDGDARAALAGAATVIDATFDFPYLAHAGMEPVNAVADVRRDGTVEVWAPTQFPSAAHEHAARIAGVAPDKVKVHTTMIGSAFGRKGYNAQDFVVEAVQVSKAVGAPVQVLWLREDDMRGGYYRPRARVEARFGLDSAARPIALEARVVSQSVLAGTSFEKYMGNGVDGTQTEGLAEFPYATPNVHVAWCRAPDGVPVQWWRSVGHSTNAFVVETLIDDAARVARRDPIDYRIDLLGAHPRHVAVLQLLRTKSGWGGAPRGRFQGVALHECFDSIVGEVAEISVTKDGGIRVHRVIAVVDCGLVVNPDTVRAQIMSGVIFGLSAALSGQITFQRGRPRQSNFDDYPMIRMDNFPVVETHVIESGAKIGGIGETGTPPIAPAVANALLAATGRRVRSLPLLPVKPA